MVERRKNRKRKDDGSNLESTVPDKPSKEEYAVAKWIRNNVRSKKTKFDRNHIVEYFTGTRAVDALLDNSPWNKTIFENRQQVVDFLDLMLRHKFFHRAKKVVISEDELYKIRGSKKKIKDKEMKEEKKSDKDKDKEKSKETDNKDLIKESTEEKKEEDKPDEKKKKPKVRLEMHNNQYFVDCNDAYVWIYEPIPIYYWFFGTLLVLGAIGVCLFPLWPVTVRHGVWYLSIAAAGFLVFILLLLILRMIIFCLLWVITLGRHHLWLLPNLIEDVGFFASFWPLYQYEYYGPSSMNDKKSSKKKKRKKDKDSDSEDTYLIQTEEKRESSDSRREPEVATEERNVEEEKVHQEKSANRQEGNEDGSESDKSNTGGDFEMI